MRGERGVGVTLRIAWFATAKGTSSRLLFESTQAAIRAGRLDAEIVVVFCNRERGQSPNTDAFLDSVAAGGTPLVTIASGAWRRRVDGATSRPGRALAPWREDYDRAVVEAITPYRPEVGMLAGYMLITTAALCERLPLLNLHPAEPGGPVGTWQEVIEALIAARASTSGLMLQRVTTELDRGPIVTWCRYALRGGASDALWAGAPDPADRESEVFRDIRARGRAPGVRVHHRIVAGHRGLASAQWGGAAGRGRRRPRARRDGRRRGRAARDGLTPSGSLNSAGADSPEVDGTGARWRRGVRILRA